jgi:two-component system, chemotaxis family, chemotaxis protein CheY
MSEREDVLVVDDEPDMQEVMGLILGTAGYAVRTAANGKQALEAVEQRMPALILLDMLMPVMDGWQFARELRARHGRGPPIVVVTAAEHAHDRGQEIGADEVLPKPFDVDELLRIVARLGVKPSAEGRPVV